MGNPYQVSESASHGTGYPLASPAAFQSLAATRPWVRLCAIVGFAIGGIFLLVCVIGVIGTIISSSGPKEMGFRTASFIPFLIMAGIALLLAGKLWGYSSAITRLLASQAPADMDLALDAQRKFWRVAGILLLCWVALMGLTVVLAFFSSATARN